MILLAERIHYGADVHARLSTVIDAVCESTPKDIVLRSVSTFNSLQFNHEKNNELDLLKIPLFNFKMLPSAKNLRALRFFAGFYLFAKFRSIHCIH